MTAAKTKPRARRVSLIDPPDAAALVINSGVGAADSQPVHPQRWLTNPNRHTLSVFAAGADAVIEREIVADHRDLGHRVGAIADQCSALDRGADFTTLDQIRFEAENTNLPEVISTWPPPKLTA